MTLSMGMELITMAKSLCWYYLLPHYHNITMELTMELPMVLSSLVKPSTAR